MTLRRHSIPLAVLTMLCAGHAWAQVEDRETPTAGLASGATGLASGMADLPDAPGFSGLGGPASTTSGNALAAPQDCPKLIQERSMPPEARAAMELQEPCKRLNPYKPFLDSPTPIPLTPKQKAYLALHNIIDPFNLLTIVGNSAYTIGTDPHTAYGPGWSGFGWNVGYSLSQDVTGNFVAVYAIASIAHQDPHYHRMPKASIPRRALHAISNAVIGQSDYGKPMPNYMVLAGYPIAIELSNLYVPGVDGNLPSSIERYVEGVATEPIGNLITEFLPDVASHVHIRILFAQRLLNQVAAGGPAPVQ